MKVLFASSELYPYAKTGGLADVSRALPLALKKYVNISRIMPLYGFMDKHTFTYHNGFTLKLHGKDYAVNIFKQNEDGIVNYFVEAPFLSDKDSLYGGAYGDYADNALRFGIFCKAIVQLAAQENITFIHLNDWHTALVALFVKELALPIQTLLTIHNLAYQGIFESNILKLLDIDKKYFTPDSIEFYDKVNFLKAGIAYSDTITTVSPQYAKEILTQEFGCGLDGFLRLHQKKLFGLLNGIDTDFFNPLQDKAVQYPYDADTLHIKEKNKQFLTQKFQIADTSAPLFIIISRLVEQKGITLLLTSFSELIHKKITLLIIGEGNANICKQFKKFETAYKNFHLFCGYDETLAHQAYAAADFLLMPSAFEPCGLNQFIAMHYGVIPVVHAVGGLQDSVHENRWLCGKGIKYDKQTKELFLSALQRALALTPEEQKKIRQFNMHCDFSFDSSALEYLKLYERLL
ncbi:glycogen synthase [Sulfurimonas sp.]